MKIELIVCVFCFVIAQVSCQKCPPTSDGYYPPHCTCKHGPSYDIATNTCPKPECPPDSVAQSAYPKCNCTEKNFDFSAYINECFRVCPPHSNGYWPNCICDDKLARFDKSMFEFRAFHLYFLIHKFVP